MTVPVKVLLKWISQHANAFDAIKTWHRLICHSTDIEEFCPHCGIYYLKPTDSIPCWKYYSYCCGSNTSNNEKWLYEYEYQYYNDDEPELC